ncbi:MAG: helix-turn-helix domain-containing protein [Oscillospiraceae bacterium]|nr:helix-turn-helix domain-containing protein [Oscillospiraceae bacterium]
MKFEGKLKEARKKQGLTQEDMAEKLCVSRAAIAKWETGKGMPDVENLRAISTLLDVSIDYLLDGEAEIDLNIIKEPINLDDYPKLTGLNKLKTTKENEVIKTRYPDAEITVLLRERILSRGERIVDNAVWLLTDAPTGTVDLADKLKDMSSYYLVEYPDKKLLVNVTKDFIISQRLYIVTETKKLQIGENVFTKGVKING